MYKISIFLHKNIENKKIYKYKYIYTIQLYNNEI